MNDDRLHKRCGLERYHYYCKVTGVVVAVVAFSNRSCTCTGWFAVEILFYSFPYPFSRPMSKEIDDLILELVDNGGGARSDDDDDGIDEYGPDLYKDEEDRRRYVSFNQHLYYYYYHHNSLFRGSDCWLFLKWSVNAF